MILLYSIFASSVVIGGLIISLNMTNTDYADALAISSFQYSPEEHS